MASFNPIVELLRVEGKPFTSRQATVEVNKHSPTYKSWSQAEVIAMLWLGEVEGVIERAGLDDNGCMTWRAK